MDIQCILTCSCTHELLINHKLIVFGIEHVNSAWIFHWVEIVVDFMLFVIVLLCLLYSSITFANDNDSNNRSNLFSDTGGNWK